jgi:hypothetical protein
VSRDGAALLAASRQLRLQPNVPSTTSAMNMEPVKAAHAIVCLDGEANRALWILTVPTTVVVMESVSMAVVNARLDSPVPIAGN